MTISEELTKRGAARLGRRHFLSVVGRGVAALGLALVGGARAADVAYAELGCCTGTECSSCPGGSCPSGYTQVSFTHCCLGHCTWTCRTCRRYNPFDECKCAHWDGCCCNPPGQCVTVPAP